MSATAESAIILNDFCYVQGGASKVAIDEAVALRGAGLDVTEPEPLPDGHRLWDQPRCIITPHTADTWDMVQPRLAARIRAHLSDAEFVELAAWVALENFRSRFNAGLGLRSQGFSDHCEIPMRAVSTESVA